MINKDFKKAAMEKTVLFITICFSFLFNVLAQAQKFNFGDEPDDSTAKAYSSLGVAGSFPIFIGCGPTVWVQPNNFYKVRNLNFFNRHLSLKGILDFNQLNF